MRALASAVLLWKLIALSSAQDLTTSIFVPREYLSNTFDVSVAGISSSTTTFLFSPGCAFGPCGPVRLTQGPGTAIYTEDNVPSGGVTTAWTCTLRPNDSPTTAECTLTSTAPWGCCEGSDTMNYPPGTGFAFPTYLARITAGEAEITGGAVGGGIGRPTETVFTQSDPGAPATATVASTTDVTASSTESVILTSSTPPTTVTSSESTSGPMENSSTESRSSTTLESEASTSSAGADAVALRGHAGWGGMIVVLIPLVLGG